MDAQIRSLIAVGAAAAVNCRPCLDNLVPQSIQAGASGADIREAIKTGFQVNRGAQAKMQRCVEDVMTRAINRHEEPSGDCSCGRAGTQNVCC